MAGAARRSSASSLLLLQQHSSSSPPTVSLPTTVCRTTTVSFTSSPCRSNSAPPLVATGARKTHTASATTTTTTTTAPPPSHSSFPAYIKPALARLQADVVEQLVGHGRLPPEMLLARKRSGEGEEEEGEGQPKPTMERLARMYFERGGKLFRPTVALLMASACNQEASHSGGSRIPDDRPAFSAHQYSLALIAEMIHVASLVHDDVIDEATIRRGAPSVNGAYGNKLAVLAGDFILARATQALCAIGRPAVISTMASIIEDLVVGEFMQMTSSLTSSKQKVNKDQRMPPPASAPFDFAASLAAYVAKSERKTASLFANTCQSVAMLAATNASSLPERAAAYGREMGLALQLVDDALDYEAAAETLGKPAAVDLKQGLVTGPLLFAARENAALATVLTRRANGDPADLLLLGGTTVLDAVRATDACAQTRQLAAKHAQRAANIASSLRTQDGAAEALAKIAMDQLERKS